MNGSPKVINNLEVNRINTGITNELKAAANYSERGYEIFLPMGNSRCDFIAVKGSEVLKVQAKSVATRYYKPKGTTYTLGVLTTSRNGEQDSYTPKEVDEFFVIGKTKAWIIPNRVVFPSTTVMLESTKEGYQPRHGWDTKSWRVSL